jgi:magnesium transporter
VTFTTFTLIASAIMFQGFNTTSAVNSISLICGFLVIFSGVYLLNLSREDPDGKTALANKFSDAPPTDGIAGYQTRRSLQARRSSIESRGRESLGDREGLMRGYDLENQQYSLGDLAEDSEEETDANGGTKKRTSFDDGREAIRANGTPSRTSFNSKADRQHVKPSKGGDR